MNGKIESMYPPREDLRNCLKVEGISLDLLSKIDLNYADPEMKFKPVGKTMFMYTPIGYAPTDTVAAFDLDWTLASSEKSLFPKDPEDISLLPGRHAILDHLVKTGYTLVVFTNQFAKSASEKEKKIERCRNFIRRLRLPVHVFIATDKDKFRKPEIGMFTEFAKIKKPKKVIFVGDAMGRPQDFEESDLKFAQAIGATSYTPEEVFPPSPIPIFSPMGEMVIFVGPPGCGKSTFYSNHLKTHVHVNQDTLGSKAKVQKMIKDTMKTKKSMVIDSTNPDRSDLYEMARSNFYDVTVIYFRRNGHAYNKLRGEKKVPDIAYHMFYKKLIVPTKTNVPGRFFELWY